MKVKVSLYATLRRYAPDGKGNDFELDFHPKSTVGAICESLGIPANIDAVMLINGRHATGDTRLLAGDTVTLYPTIAGG